MAAERLRPSPGGRRLFWYGASAVVLLLLVRDAITLAQQPLFEQGLAGDFRFYLDATQRWLDGGGFYAPYQLAGPYPMSDTDVLFPPPILLVLVPFTVLPAALWWAIPLGAIAFSLWRLSPAPWAWTAILLLAWYQQTEALVYAGNPVMWAVAALALGTLWAGPAAFVLLKPSLFPFAFFGAWRREWLPGLAAFAVVSLLFLPMWPDYVTALRNVSGPRAGLLHSLPDVPFMLIPLVGWLARRRGGIPSPTRPRWLRGRQGTRSTLTSTDPWPRG